MNPKDLVGAKKAPLALVPPAAVIGMAEAFGNGAAKYGPYNWRDQPIQVLTYLEAAERHILAFRDGQDHAEDTGIHHIAHAMAGLAILYDALMSDRVVDNRPISGPAADLLRAQDRSTPPVAAPAVPDVGADILHPAFTSEEAVLSVAQVRAQVLLDAMQTQLSKVGLADEPVYFGGYDLASKADDSVVLKVENRGDWPPDTRVNGLLTCCGQQEHTVECPQWR